jgi:hypothetical protein
MVDALQRAILMLREGREALAQYLDAVGYLRSPAFWLVAQALAEILEGEDEGRDLHEFLTLRRALCGWRRWRGCCRGWRFWVWGAGWKRVLGSTPRGWARSWWGS